MSSERRKAQRLSWKQSVGVQTGDSQHRAVGVDLSEGGVALLGDSDSARGPIPGDRVLLTFRIDGIPIVVQGETVSLMKSGRLLRSGIRFVQLSRTQRALIARHAERR